MKKLLILLPLLFIVGCTNKMESEKYTYLAYKKELQNKEVFDENDDADFSSYFNIERENNEIVNYSIIIESPQINMYNVKALLIHDYASDTVYPSVGIFDDPVNLLEGSSDKIILEGNIQTTDDISNINFKLYLEYQDEDGLSNKIYYKLSRG